MGAQGFPLKLDIFKAIAEKLHMKREAMAEKLHIKR